MSLFRMQSLVVCASTICLWTSTLSALAAPPVRIALVPNSGSGIEQEVLDRITAQLRNSADIELSTVNPDWFVTCNIVERTDQVSGAVRYNGNVVVKTRDGHVINTIAVQKYNQDFSLQPGAPINKALIDGAARDVIGAIVTRCVGPIEQAVDLEIQTRDQIIEAHKLAQTDAYDQALQTLQSVPPDSPEFSKVQHYCEELMMEKESLQHFQAGEQEAAQGKYQSAIDQMLQVNTNSKRYAAAKQKVASYRLKLTPKLHATK